VDHHAPAVDIVDFKVPQFIAAHAGCIECGDNGSVLHVVGMIENAGNLFGAQYGRQPDPLPHPRHLFIKPGPVKRLHIQELQRGPMDLKRGKRMPGTLEDVCYLTIGGARHQLTIENRCIPPYTSLRLVAER
jgi:hypothetical protein